MISFSGEYFFNGTKLAKWRITCIVIIQSSLLTVISGVFAIGILASSLCVEAYLVCICCQNKEIVKERLIIETNTD